MAFSQNDHFAENLEKGKEEFKKEHEAQDFKMAVDYLKKAVELRPNDAEAHYFLGYAYSRLNSKDGKGLIQMSLPLTLLCSEEFETVNRLTPKYPGEMIILDPYSKIGSEWGSLAMSYWHNNQSDSAIWAFKEGKRRGGFGAFFLSMGRACLDLCSPNSLLISSGDNLTIPLWYLQIVEGYRKDVSVIDISLLNTTWYPRFLSNKGLASFDLSTATMDSLEYCAWQDSTVTAGSLSWMVKPSYMEQYLLRGDRVFLSLLKDNKFRRDLFFTTAFMEEAMVGLNQHLLPMGMVDKVNATHQSGFDDIRFKSEMTKILFLLEKINLNSPDECIFVNQIRFKILEKIGILVEQNKKQEAKALLELLDKYANEKSYPFGNEELKKYADLMRELLTQ